MQLKWIRSLALLLVLGALSLPRPADAEPRLALVIGNSHYDGDLPALPSAAIDARLVAETLKKTGFTVSEYENLNLKSMKRAIAGFGDDVAAVHGEVALFYYTGYAVQYDAENYLLPVGATIQRQEDIDIEAIAFTQVLNQMDLVGNPVKIIILDASHPNPIADMVDPYKRGLAEVMAPPPATFISFSTLPGRVSLPTPPDSLAPPGATSPSLYATALSQTLLAPGLNINQLFQQVRDLVINGTNGRQTSWDSTSLLAPFYFVPPKGG